MSFKIQIDREGEHAEFDCEADELIMDAARRQGIWLANYCKQGGCGACSAVMLAGSVANVRSLKGAPQEPAVGDIVRPCSARPTADLELQPLSAWKRTE